MPHAKFRADPLKTVTVHKEQRNRQTKIWFLPRDAICGICCHRVFVCLSQVESLQRWLNLSSHKQHHMIAQGF